MTDAKAAAQTRAPSIPDDYWPMLAKIESGKRPMAKAKTSSASGLYQFIRATWIGEGCHCRPDMTKPFGGLTPDAVEQLARARASSPRTRLRSRAGIEINRASLYAAHFPGVGTAARLISADIKASAEKIAGPAATAATRSILDGKDGGRVSDLAASEDWGVGAMIRMMIAALACVAAMTLASCANRPPLDLSKHAALRRSVYMTATAAAGVAMTSGWPLPGSVALRRQAAATATTALVVLDANCPTVR